MLIQDLNFFEQIDSLDDVQGGSSTTSATSEKPGATSKASATGEETFIGTRAVDNGVSVSTVLGADLNGADFVTLDQLLLDAGIETVIGLSLL